MSGLRVQVRRRRIRDWEQPPRLLYVTRHGSPQEPWMPGPGMVCSCVPLHQLEEHSLVLGAMQHCGPKQQAKFHHLRVAALVE